MYDTAPKRSTIIAAIVVPVALVLLGVGCFQVADQLGTDSVAPVKTDLEALSKAKEVTNLQNAKIREEAEAVSDDLTIALILTENGKAPADAKVEGSKIGCNDQVAYVKQHRAASTDSVVHDALMTLFSQKEANTDGLYNSLWQSNLTVDKIQSRDGVTTEVWLKGKTASGGVCDDPRIKAQIEATISRLKPNFKIYLNGTESAYRCLGDLKGDCK